MVAQTTDLLDDPFLLDTKNETVNNNSHRNDSTVNGAGTVGLGRWSGLGQVGPTSSVGLAGRNLVPSMLSGTNVVHPNYSSSNVQVSSSSSSVTAAAASARSVGVDDLPSSAVKDRQKDVTVEVNLSRFCINSSLFQRVSSLNWVQLKRSGHSNAVLKLDARCHPDVFEMVLKFFLHNALPEFSELTNRKATELFVLAKPLDGAEPLVHRAELFLAAKSNSVVRPSSAASFLKRQLSSVSSLRPSRSSEEKKKDDDGEAANPTCRGSQPSVTLSQSQPFPQMLSQPQQSQKLETLVHARTIVAVQLQPQPQQMMLNLSQRPNSSIRSIDNRSIPSHVDMKYSLDDNDKILRPKTTSERVASITRADSNISTIEDESISKLSLPSSRANSEDQNNENRQTSNQPIDFDTAVPPSVTTFTPPQFSGKAMTRIENRRQVMTTPDIGFGDEMEKKQNKKDKRKFSFSPKIFRTIMGGTSNRGVPKMSHEEYCRTSDHLL